MQGNEKRGGGALVNGVGRPLLADAGHLGGGVARSSAWVLDTWFIGLCMWGPFLLVGLALTCIYIELSAGACLCR